MDNTGSCTYINKFGGKKKELNLLAREIWFWCINRKIHLTAAHIPGKKNIEADKESRSFNSDLEWSLNQNVFEEISNIHIGLSIDLFASRLNHKLPKYVTHRPEPYAFAIDAFSLTWSNDFFYIFPPVSLLPRILQKIQEDGTEAVLVARIWPTQVWWPSLLQLLTGKCYNLPNPQKCLHLPHRPERKHPLKKMKLGLFRVSGRSSRKEESPNKPDTLSSNHGRLVRNNNITHTYQNGYISAGVQITPLNLP